MVSLIIYGLLYDPQVYIQEIKEFLNELRSDKDEGVMSASFQRENGSAVSEDT